MVGGVRVGHTCGKPREGSVRAFEFDASTDSAACAFVEPRHRLVSFLFKLLQHHAHVHHGREEPAPGPGEHLARLGSAGATRLKVLLFFDSYPPPSTLCSRSLYSLGICSKADYQIIRFSNCLQVAACICQCAAMISQNDACQQAAQLLNCIAELVLRTVEGCMGAQIKAELADSQARSGQPVEADVAYRIDPMASSVAASTPAAPQVYVTSQPEAQSISRA